VSFLYVGSAATLARFLVGATIPKAFILRSITSEVSISTFPSRYFIVNSLDLLIIIDKQHLNHENRLNDNSSIGTLIIAQFEFDLPIVKGLALRGVAQHLSRDSGLPN
jgi:hypothetical protein